LKTFMSFKIEVPAFKIHSMFKSNCPEMVYIFKKKNITNLVK